MRIPTMRIPTTSIPTTSKSTTSIPTASKPTTPSASTRRRSAPRRSGKAAVIILAVLAVLSLLVAVGGTIAALRSGAGDSLGALIRQTQGVAQGADEFYCPGSIAFEAKKGGALLLLLPDSQGRVPDPKEGTAFNVTVTDATGGAIEVNMNESPRMGNGQGQAETLAFIEFPADGTYTIAVAANDGTTTGSIAVLAGTREDFEALRNFAAAAGIGTLGGCSGVCGLVLALSFGIAALVVGPRKPRPVQPDPLAL